MNISIPLPALTDPTQQCYFVRVAFQTPCTILQITDDAGNVYVQSVADRGLNYGYYAGAGTTPAKSASTLLVVYSGGTGILEEDLCDIRAWKVSGIVPSQLLALNYGPVGLV
jgi:hypothetical protein